MYSKTLLEQFDNPRNVGDLRPPAITAEVSNPVCGDTMRLAAEFRDGRVSAVRHRTYGCVAAIAAGSALTEWMKGRSIAELGALDAAVVGELLGGLPAASSHVAVLSTDAVGALLRLLAPSS